MGVHTCLARNYYRATPIEQPSLQAPGKLFSAAQCNCCSRMPIPPDPLRGRHATELHLHRSPVAVCWNRRENHSRAYGGIGCRIEQDKTASAAVLGVSVEVNRPAGLDSQHTDGVHLQPVCGLMLVRRYIYTMPDGFHFRGDRLSRVLEQVSLRRIERLLTHPHHVRFELPRHLRGSLKRRDHVSAADVQLVFQRQRHRHRRDGFLEPAIERFDTLYTRPLSGWKGQNRISGMYRARNNLPRVAAKGLIRTHYALDWKTERGRPHSVEHRYCLQKFEQAGALEPPHLPASLHDIVACERADRQEVNLPCSP